jgi:hypothetical protein
VFELPLVKCRHAEFRTQYGRHLFSLSDIHGKRRVFQSEIPGVESAHLVVCSTVNTRDKVTYGHKILVGTFKEKRPIGRRTR